MKVLLCHNYYRLRGGEDQAFETEVELLRQGGHEVQTFSVTNKDLDEGQALDAAKKTIWNPESEREVGRVIEAFQPDVLHVHNFFPQLSPSIFRAARDRGVATVQTLHNFRLGCLNGLFYRDGAVCERCLGRPFALDGVRFRCYRGSLGASLATGAMNAWHWRHGTWANLVDRYICLTEFARSKFRAIGLPEAKLAVKPNLLVSDPGPGPGNGGYAIWIGRLSQEKGVEVLLEAWRGPAAKVPLHVYGDGPMRGQVEALAAVNPAVRLLGHRPRDEVFAALRHATCLVLPSICYEGFPMALIESMAMGIPAVASRLGAMAAIVRDGETGALFQPGDGFGLGATVGWLADHPIDRARLAANARAEYGRHYTSEANLERLLAIYRDAIAEKEAARVAS